MTRVKQYFEKIKHAEFGGAKRENLKLNKPAAARIVKHALVLLRSGKADEVLVTDEYRLGMTNTIRSGLSNNSRRRRGFTPGFMSARQTRP